MSNAAPVLLISNVTQSSGYSYAGQLTARALDAAGIDTYVRNINLIQSRGEIHPRVQELLNRPIAGISPQVVIQHTLPHFMVYQGGMTNIAYFDYETDNFRHTVWPERLNMMDEVWVVTKQQHEACLKSGVTRPISVVPHPIDLEKYQKPRTRLSQLDSLLEGNFAFYTIGEFNRRKNLGGLLKAFHAEFSPHEPVSLVIKTGVPGETPERAFAQVKELCDTVKRGLKLYRNESLYKQEVIITEQLTDDNLLSLHETGDCYVSPSYGEAWALECSAALAMGKRVIASERMGCLEYFSDNCYYGVPTYKEPCFGVNTGIADLYTANECWESPDLTILRKQMREAYEDRGRTNLKGECARRECANLSLLTVGLRMKELLENAQKAEG